MQTVQPKTYLSIDLDYWKKFPVKFLNMIMDLDVPTAIAVEHHSLLDHINYFTDCRRLINIDNHADLCGNVAKDEPVDCGIWGSYVTWRKNKGSSFVWSYPSRRCTLGKTNLTGCWCDSEENENPFFVNNPRKLCGWSHTCFRMEPIILLEELKSVQAVGICLSPDYLDSKIDITAWAEKLLALAEKKQLEIIEDDKAMSWERCFELYATEKAG